MKHLLSVFCSNQTLLAILLRCSMFLTLNSLHSQNGESGSSTGQKPLNIKKSIGIVRSSVSEVQDGESNGDKSFWNSLFTNKAIDQLDIGDLAGKSSKAVTDAATADTKGTEKSPNKALFPFEFSIPPVGGGDVLSKRRDSDGADGNVASVPVSSDSFAVFLEKQRISVSVLALDTWQRLLSLIMAFSVSASGESNADHFRKQSQQQVNSWISNIYELLASDLRKTMSVGLNESESSKTDPVLSIPAGTTCFAGAAVLIDYPDNTISKLIVQCMTAFVIVKSKYQVETAISDVPGLLKEAYPIKSVECMYTDAKDIEDSQLLNRHCAAVSNSSVSADLFVGEKCSYGQEEVGDR